MKKAAGTFEKNEAIVSKQRHKWKSVILQTSDGDKGTFCFSAQAPIVLCEIILQRLV